MSLELMLFYGLLAHFVGDYILQNSYMAYEKTKNSLIALIHALIHGLLFYFIIGINEYLLVIILTHFLIDRFRLAIYWVKLVNWNFRSLNHGFTDNTPQYLSTWLLFIIDNIFHILINTISIVYYFKSL